VRRGHPNVRLQILVGPAGHNRRMEQPKIVSFEQWRQAREELLKAEKEATRALDAASLQPP